MALALQASADPSGAQFPEDLAASLMSQVQAASIGKEVPFAKSMLGLLEVTARISQLDDLVVSAQAGAETETPEARRWKDISTMSAQFARSSLLDRQLAAIEELLDLGARGGSLVKEASGQGEQKVALSPPPAPVPKPMAEASAPPPGLPALMGPSQPPPGLSAPPGFSAPPPGLSAPPGLAAPPGLEHLAPAPQASAPARATPAWRRPEGAPSKPRRAAPEGAVSRKPWAKAAQQQPAAAEKQDIRPMILPSTFAALNLDDYTDDDDDDSDA